MLNLMKVKKNSRMYGMNQTVVDNPTSMNISARNINKDFLSRNVAGGS